MAIIKNAKNINIQVANNYTSLSKISHEQSEAVIIEALKQNLELSSQKKTILQGFGREGALKNDNETNEKVNGYYYNYNGSYEGHVTGEKKGNENDVYACDGKGKEKDTFLNAKKLDITHDDFCWAAGIIKLESGTNDYDELNCIANTASNRAKHKKTTLRILLEKGEPAGSKYIPYSTVPKQNKKKLEDSDKTVYANNTRKALINVLNGGDDNSYSAELWDGDDFLVWGAGEINPYGKISHAKFREYGFIKIPKNIYERYKNEVVAKYGSNISYGDSGSHTKLSENDQKHTHYSTTNGVKKIKYPIPQTVFTDKANWKSGDFYYETKQNQSEGLVATSTYGRTIFWKLQKKNEK